jgi:hypothetical protein
VRAKVYITIEDDTSEEKLVAFSAKDLQALYRVAFENMVYAALKPGSRADVRVVVEDNTKEAST